MILVDAGPLVAICDGRDALHKTAVSHLKRLAGGPFATCGAVLAEACCHLPHSAQRQRLAALLTQLDVGPLAADSERLFREDVFTWLAAYADHDPDWADGCLAVLAGRDRTLKVWTYDREFWTTWRRPDGSAIPMAAHR